jgi:alpha-beta hydrolase superfamily lysophospholipase
MAGALVRRVGPAFNVFGWDWNAATFVSLDPRANGDSAVAQGRALAEALLRSGAMPARTHLIGHSSGSIVAAARTLAFEHGRPLAQLTLLEPAAGYHSLVFERLAAGSSAQRVENYWSPGASGYGREVSAPGVVNFRVDGPRSYLGVVSPRRSGHMNIVRWYITTIDDPRYWAGFNQSLLLAEGR